ncbi:MAG: beta-galactosidase [Bacillota bacterium]
MFPIGTQFYRAPTPLPENWEKDLKTARENGLNIIRAWLMWNWYSQKQGRFDFMEIRTLLDLCHKYDLKAVLLFNLESAPAWAQRKYPEALYVSATGRRFYPEAMGNTPAGGFPGLCFDHEKVAAEGKKYITEVVRRFRSHPAVYGWEPANEPLFEPARYNDEIYCYCGKTVAKFQRWLAVKYGGDINKLNAVWRRKYGRFDEAQPPRRRGSYADWVDWRLFSMGALQDTIAWRVKAIRDNDPDHPVIIHTRGGSGVTRPATKEGIDDWAFAGEADIYGTAAFPQCGPEHEYFIAMAGARSAARGKEFWMSELQAGPYGMGIHRNDAEPRCFICNSTTMEGIRDVQTGAFDPGIVTPERLKMWAWSGIAQGGKGILFWQYRCELFGLEYGFGLTDMDGAPSERLQVVKELSRIVHQHEDLIKNARLPEVKIAAGVTPINDLVNYAALGCHCQIKNSIKGLHKALWSLDYLLDFVRIDELVVDQEYKQYKVIYLPFPIWISRRSVAKLKEWVAAGGTLVCEASAGQLDETFFTTVKAPGLGLDELFGCVRRDIRSAREIPPLVYGSARIETGFYKEVLEPTTGKVMGVFETGEPAIICNDYGKGKAVYIGSNPFYQYNGTANKGFLQFISDINRDVFREAFTNQTDVSARVLINGRTWLVFLLNALNRTFETELTVMAKGRVMDLFTGDPVACSYAQDRMIINTAMKGFDTKVYIVEMD